MKRQMKAYHSEWSHDDRMKARSGGIILDEDGAWIYVHTHTDTLGQYDLWILPGSSTEPQMRDMTLRDYFAAQAVTGMVSTAAAPCMTTLAGTESAMAEAAYKLADAMMKARGAETND